MKKTQLHFFFFLLIWSLSSSVLYAQRIPEEMIRAFTKGDVEILSGYFHERLQVNITNKEFTCSKAQAKEILRDFFSKNKPGSFKIVFEGGKEDSNFSIAILVTSSGNYRVNIFFKKIDDNYLVHLLRIEKYDERAF